MCLRIREWLFRALPKRLLTRLTGRILRHPASRMLIPVFAGWYRIDLHEAEKPWRAYASLGEFFSRRLPAGRRVAEPDPALVASPVDGVVSETGMIRAGTLLQIKGMPYSVRDLLEDAACADLDGGSYVTIYLAPGDYHRIHAPLTAVATSVVHVGGSLFPVNRAGVSSVRGLFVQNERVISWFVRGSGSFALVKVGSLLVGSVRTTLCEPACLSDRQRRSGSLTHCLKKPVAVRKGEELGWFEFGSTVILIFPPGEVELAVSPGQRVRALETIGRWIRPDAAV